MRLFILLIVATLAACAASRDTTPRPTASQRAFHELSRGYNDFVHRGDAAAGAVFGLALCQIAECRGLDHLAVATAGGEIAGRVSRTYQATRYPDIQLTETVLSNDVSLADQRTQRMRRAVLMAERLNQATAGATALHDAQADQLAYFDIMRQNTVWLRDLNRAIAAYESAGISHERLKQARRAQVEDSRRFGNLRSQYAELVSASSE